MKQRSIRLFRLVVLVVTAMIIVAPATAADEPSGTVVATVSALAGPCIAVGLVGDIDFGPLAFSTAGAEVSAQSGQYGLDNCSTEMSEFTAAASGGFLESSLGEGQVLQQPWSLTTITSDLCGQGEGLYRMGVRATLDLQNFSETNLSGDATTLAYPTSGDVNPEFESIVAPTAGLTVINKITMPCVGSAGAGDNVVTLITYTATLAPVLAP